MDVLTIDFTWLSDSGFRRVAGREESLKAPFKLFAEINEGLVRFDIVFYVRMRDGLSQMIVNVESRKDEPSGYNLLDRAVFYVSRLISSQKERDFVHTNYNDIRRVFSIWICMNLDENSMGYVHLAYDKLIGENVSERFREVKESAANLKGTAEVKNLSIFRPAASHWQ